MVDKPDWITEELLRTLQNTVATSASANKYFNGIAAHHAWYRGERGIAPMDDFDDEEIDESNATARKNLIKKTADEMVSIFLKNYPIVRRTPYKAEDAELADGLDVMWLSAWQTTHGQDKVRSQLRESAITGLSIAKIIWDPAIITNDKSGEIQMGVLPPRSVRFDPEATNTDRGNDARFIIHHTTPSTLEAIRRYGEEAEIALNLRDRRGRKKKKKKDKEWLEDLQKNLPTVNVDEYWIFPTLLYGSSLVGGDEINSAEYPYGVVVTTVEDHIVRVMANPFVGKKRVEEIDEYGLPKSRTVEIGPRRHPFVPLWWCRITDEDGKAGFYDTMGMVEAMTALQFNVNALRRNVAINARSTANPATVINPDAVDMPIGEVDFSPSAIIPINENYTVDQAIRQLQPSQMPQYIFNMLFGDENAIPEFGGLKPGVTGIFPAPAGGTSHTPFATIGTLQESAFNPLWVYVDELSNALKDMSIIYDGLMQLKYPPRRYSATSENGEMVAVEWTEAHITAEFSRDVVSGATTPLFDIEKQARMAEIRNDTIEAMMSQNPAAMKATIAYLQGLGYPWAQQFIELLQQELQRVELMQQQAMQLGAMAVTQEGQQAQGNGDMQALADELGVSPEQLQAAMAEG